MELEGKIAGGRWARWIKSPPGCRIASACFRFYLLHFQSSFLLQATCNSSSTWASDSHMRDPGGVSGSWLLPDQSWKLQSFGVWVSRLKISLLLARSLYLVNKINQSKDYNKYLSWCNLRTNPWIGFSYMFFLFLYRKYKTKWTPEIQTWERNENSVSC